jgi:hypothetical protein
MLAKRFVTAHARDSTVRGSISAGFYPRTSIFLITAIAAPYGHTFTWRTQQFDTA